MIFCVFPLGLSFLVFIHRGVPAFAQEDLCDKDRRYLDSCVHKLPSLLTYGSIAGIPSSKRAVDTACSAFRTGMQCFDLYAATCLSGNERKVMDANVAGARHTFSYLCDDPVFQQEYLQHTACYQTVSKSWDECANKFLEKVRHGNNSKTRAFDICCANHAFLDCVHQAGKRQCEKEAANFLRRIAEVLANVRVYDTACQAKAADGIPTRETCAACTAHLGHSLLLGFFFLVFTQNFQLTTFCLG